MDQFFQLLYILNKYFNKIFVFIRQSSFYGDSLSRKIEQKEAKWAEWEFKKAKGNDNHTTPKITRIAQLRDQWLIKKNITTPALKAKMKKMKTVEDKQKAKVKVKQDENCKTSKIKSMKSLTLGNI